MNQKPMNFGGFAAGGITDNVSIDHQIEINPSVLSPGEQVLAPKEPKTNSPLGARYLGSGRCSFCIWAPSVERVDLVVVEPQARDQDLEPSALGYHSVILEGVFPGTRYFFRLDGRRQVPDPASRLQPETVHGPSDVIDPAFDWTDQ